MKKEESKNGSIVGMGVGTIFFALFFFGAKQFFKPDLEAELKDAALELTKQSPMEIDPFTRLDSAGSKGTTNFIYYYTLFDMEKSEVNLDTVNKYVRSALIDKIKNHPDLKVFRENNIIMDYNYYDKNREFVTQISVTPELYK